jgi:chaperonin cofactor prefoldin
MSNEFKRTKEFLTKELNENKNELKRTEEFLTKELNNIKEEFKKTKTNLRIYNEFWTNISSNLETGISYTKLIYT